MVGRTLGRYEIVGQLGAGGMGEVYRAHDPRIDREVALKVIAADLADDPERLERFQREARALGALNHPNIVTIYELAQARLVAGSEGEDTGTEPPTVHFLTMELVEGRPLDRVTPAGGLELDRFFQIAVPLADALAAAHDRGITHRDLKPANVMVTEQGRVKVLDFGLAKRRTGGPAADLSQLATEAMTQDGMLVGTVPYMSPEQVEGKPVDHRSDIFSLGIVLYEMLTGQRPFQGESQIALASSILNDQPASVTEVRGELPGNLGRLIQRCLEKDLERRYQSAKDIRNELEELRREHDPAGVPARPPKSGVWWRRAPTFAAVAVLVLTFASVALYLGRARGPEVTSTGRSAAIRSLAVLPLDNLSNDPEQQYFVAGMHDAMISSLAKLGQLKVISRTSVMQYRDAPKPLPEIARELGVQAVVEGSVLKVDGKVRVTAQLIDANDDAPLWTESYDEDVADVLAVHSRVARAIADEIQLVLDPEAKARLAAAEVPVDAEAQDAYLRAVYLLSTEIYSERAVDLLEQATEKSPGFARAHVKLAVAYQLLLQAGLVDRATACSKARPALERAIGADPTLAEAYAQLHWVNEACPDDSPGLAENPLERAIELDPNNVAALTSLAYVQITQPGRSDEAVMNARRALERDPLNPDAQSAYGNVLYWAGHFDEAVEHFEKLVAMEPENIWWVRQVALMAAVNHDPERAVDAADRLLSMATEETAWMIKSAAPYAYARAGLTDRAMGLLEQMQQEDADPTLISWVYLALGDLDRGYEWLERAVEERRTGNEELAFFDPSMALLMGDDPRFAELHRRLAGAEQAEN